MAKIKRSEQDWAQRMSPEQFRICRQKGTERAFTGKYVNTKDKGVYRCSACGEPLFSSDTKYDSGSGWPSFNQPLNSSCIDEAEDNSLGMQRIEVMCAQCDSHLGHVFPDGPPETGLRYCINSASLDLDTSEDQ